jgi:hypothetical protein
MRYKGSLVTGAFLALSLALIPNNAVAAQKLTPGGPCKVLNQKVVSQNKTHTCVESGNKLMWSKGVVVAKPKSNSASAPSVGPTPTPTPVPNNSSTDSPTSETPTPGETCSRNKNALKNC